MKLSQEEMKKTTEKKWEKQKSEITLEVNDWLYSQGIEATDDQIEELVTRLHDTDEDFYVELEGGEYRFIHEQDIWDIYVEGIEEITKECYLCVGQKDLPWWISIDWEKTAETCYDADGYGHHFASYDGEEDEQEFWGELYYIFRTN